MIKMRMITRTDGCKCFSCGGRTEVMFDIGFIRGPKEVDQIHMLCTDCMNDLIRKGCYMNTEYNKMIKKR